MKEKLTNWLKNNIPDDNLIYKNGLYDQTNFVSNFMRQIFLESATEYNIDMEFDKRLKIMESFEPYVISYHRSKSVVLPVMELDLSRIGVKIVLRNNFYDWCISIESESDIDCDFMGLLTDTKGYFEGFPEDRVYGYYSETNKKNFSLCLNNNYELYTFMFLLKNYLTK